MDPELNPKGLFNFSFEFACGNDQTCVTGPSLPTFQTMLERLKDKIHFAILNGDWLYETQREYRMRQWTAQVDASPDEVPEVLKVAPTLVGVWQNYKHFLDQGETLARWHRHIPSFFTYDDHEILNDVWGAGTPGLRDRRAVYRDIGVRAWYDYLGMEQSRLLPATNLFREGPAGVRQRCSDRFVRRLQSTRFESGLQSSCPLGYHDGRSEQQRPGWRGWRSQRRRLSDRPGAGSASAA